MTLQLLVGMVWSVFIVVIVSVILQRNVVKALAVWVGNKIADLWGGSPRW